MTRVNVLNVTAHQLVVMKHGSLMGIVILLIITSFADMMVVIAVLEIVSIQQHMRSEAGEHVQHVLIVILQIMPLVDSAE